MLNKILIYLVLISFLVNNCKKTEPIDNNEKFVVIMKEMQIILTSQLPDSIKSKNIHVILVREGISMEEYQKLRWEYMEENPLKSIGLLQNVEKLIREDIQKSEEDQQ